MIPGLAPEVSDNSTGAQIRFAVIARIFLFVKNLSFLKEKDNIFTFLLYRGKGRMRTIVLGNQLELPAVLE